MDSGVMPCGFSRDYYLPLSLFLLSIRSRLGLFHHGFIFFSLIRIGRNVYIYICIWFMIVLFPAAGVYSTSFVAFHFYVEAMRLAFRPGLILNCNYPAILKESCKANLRLRLLRPADSRVKRKRQWLIGPWNANKKKRETKWVSRGIMRGRFLGNSRENNDPEIIETIRFTWRKLSC